MKSQILKIAGVKSEKEFYKKYPSEKPLGFKRGLSNVYVIGIWFAGFGWPITPICWLLTCTNLIN